MLGSSLKASLSFHGGGQQFGAFLLPSTSAFVFFFQPVHFGVQAKRQWHLFSWGVGFEGK